MRFQVPQFIEVEDKIFGPLTLKQFIYLAGAGGVVVVFWSILPFFFAVIASAPFVLLGLALAFYKINDRSFIFVLQSAFSYFLSHRLYLWQKEEKRPAEAKKEAAETGQAPTIYVPKLSESKLKDLSWSLDIKESIYSDRGQRK